MTTVRLVSDEPELIVQRRGRLGVLTLNRPRAINALTHGMVLGILSALSEWAEDEAVRAVLITGAGERGLCAGGDIVALYRDATAGDTSQSARFWSDEYRMNSILSRYPKPIVAVQDGIVLGGGIGVSAHCSHRIVTERSRLGLPEVGIGFVPDVGATWLLSRAPGELGVAAALAATRLGAGDAIAMGLSDAFVPAERIADLLGALQADEPDAVIARYATAPPAGEFAAARDWIDAAFAFDTVAEVLAGLRAAGAPGAELLASIESASPTALAVTLESLRRARALRSLEEALVQEYRVSLHCLSSPDFAEGVRAQVIDKDRTPRWAVVASVAPFFEPPVGGDLNLTDLERP